MASKKISIEDQREENNLPKMRDNNGQGRMLVIDEAKTASLARELISVAKTLVKEKYTYPRCANCGDRISIWAKSEGSIPSTAISMLLCHKKACNEAGVKHARIFLESKD